jgi:phosphotransferase system enzyme I (PtsI)
MGQRVQGLGVSPGVASGRVYLIHAELLPVVPEAVPPERVGREIERFHETRDLARQEIQELKERVHRELGERYAGILEVQQMILDDPRLVRDTVRRIRVGRVSASWALKEVVAEFLRRFGAVEDAYIRERGGELSDVHRRMQRLLRGGGAGGDALPEGPLIAVGHSLGPSDAVALARRGVVGLATDMGGRTSHTAILAQALSVPAVAGLHDVSQRVCSGDAIIVDGDAGEVSLLPTPEETEAADQRRRAWIEREQELVRDAEAPTTTADGVELMLRANIEFPQELEAAKRYGARGVGLYRSEFLFVSRSPEFPTEQEHFETYVQIAETMAPHSAVIRTLDLGGEKYFHDVLDRNEPNPVLGLRGVRLCLKRPDIFRPQIRGLVRAATRGNLKMMLPLVTVPDEIAHVRRLVAEEARSLKDDGVEARETLPIGIMIEVPAAAAAADILAREADFFSIGTNDLIQYALAVDRNNESVAYLYQPQHPGLLRTLRFIIASAAEQGIPVSLCGEMATDVESLPLLVGMGLRELSVQPRAISAVRQALREIDTHQASEAAEVALAGTSDPVAQGGKPSWNA